LAVALLAALVWILRLLAKRLIRVLAGLRRLIALSILLTILVGIILFVITSLEWSETYDNQAYGGSFRKIKKKAVQFKCGGLLANYRDLCLQLPPRAWTFHFAPTSCSWLNAIEGFFAILTKRRLKHGVFRSVDDLQAAINWFLEEHNVESKPFKWTADPDKIIAAVRRGHRALEWNSACGRS
jgi:transposase